MLAITDVAKATLNVRRAPQRRLVLASKEDVEASMISWETDGAEGECAVGLRPRVRVPYERASL